MMLSLHLRYISVTRTTGFFLYFCLLFIYLTVCLFVISIFFNFSRVYTTCLSRLLVYYIRNIIASFRYLFQSIISIIWSFLLSSLYLAISRLAYISVYHLYIGLYHCRPWFALHQFFVLSVVCYVSYYLILYYLYQFLCQSIYLTWLNSAPTLLYIFLLPFFHITLVVPTLVSISVYIILFYHIGRYIYIYMLC